MVTLGQITGPAKSSPRPLKHPSHPKTTADSSVSRLTKGLLPKLGLDGFLPDTVVGVATTVKGCLCPGRISTLLTDLIAWKAKSQRNCLVQTDVPPTLCPHQMRSWHTRPWPIPQGQGCCQAPGVSHNGLILEARGPSPFPNELCIHPFRVPVSRSSPGSAGWVRGAIPAFLGLTSAD